MLGQKPSESDGGPKGEGAPPRMPTGAQVEAVPRNRGDVPRATSESQETSPGTERGDARSPATLASHPPETEFGGAKPAGAFQELWRSQQEREKRRREEDDAGRRRWQLEDNERHQQERREEAEATSRFLQQLPNAATGASIVPESAKRKDWTGLSRKELPVERELSDDARQVYAEVPTDSDLTAHRNRLVSFKDL